MKCIACGKEFTPRNVKSKFCSSECGYQYTLKTMRESTPEYTRKCPVCLSKFTTKNPQKIFCCTDCANEYLDIARHVMAKNRKKIMELIELAKAHPELSTKEIMKGYPTK